MHRSLRLTLGVALLAAPLLAACGDDDTAGDPPATTAATSGGGGATSSFVVHAEDPFAFDEDSYTADAGTIDVTYVNDGSTLHSLVIEGVDRGDFFLEVGDQDEGSVELDAGTYELYCDVSGHAAAGMTAQLLVS